MLFWAQWWVTNIWCTFFSFCVHWILLLSCPSSVHLCLFHCFLFMVWFVSSTWSLSELVMNGCCWYSNSEKTSRCSNITYNVGFMKSGHLTTCVFCMFICLCCVFPAINDIIWGIQTTDTHISVFRSIHTHKVCIFAELLPWRSTENPLRYINANI